MSTKRTRDGSPKPGDGSPMMNHKKGSSDGGAAGKSSGRLLPNHNLPNIHGEDDGMDMSPLKRLQRLKQNGSLRLTLKGKNSKRNLNFPADVENNHGGSDSSLSDPGDGSRSDVSGGGSPYLGQQTKSCVRVARDTRETKNVRFQDDGSDTNVNDSDVTADDNGNNSNSCEILTRDSNGNLNLKNTHAQDTDLKTTETNEKVINEVKEGTDVDSETGEFKMTLTQGEKSPEGCKRDKRIKPAIPAKPPNLARLKTKAPVVQKSKPVESSSPKSPESPTPVTVISAQNSESTNDDKKNQNVVTVQYTPVAKPTVQYAPVAKPVIEVKLIQRQTKSQTPSPNLRHGSNNRDETVLIRSRSRSQSSPQEEKWLSRSVDDLDKPVDIYACPTSFLRDTNVKLRHSFIDKGFTDKEREAIYNSVGDVQTLLRNSFVNEDEKIYSLPQPACYGDNTLKAVKKITEKYDTLQRRKLRALSFREGAKYSGAGASFSQPSSPVSPTGMGPGVLPPPPPSSPPPPLSAGASSVGSVFVDSPDGYGYGNRGSVLGSPRSPVPPPPPPRHTPSPSEEAPPSPTGITVRDTARLDLFYHGRDSEVVVCQCLADIRFGTAVHSGSEEVSDWSAVTSIGVPLLVLNTGKGKRRRELLVTIAERETGFPLWSDKINYLSNYRSTDPTTHVLQLSNNLKKVAGITFHCEKSAAEFLERFTEITKDPNDELWRVSTGSSGSGNGSKKKRRPFSFRRLKLKKPSKNDISSPCNFAHITSVDPQDHVICEDLQNLSPLSRSLPNSPTSSRPSSIANG